MNTHAEYRRHVSKNSSTTDPAPSQSEVNELARHGDPSLTATGPKTPSGKSIAWVRPTELHAYAGALIGRGIDLQAELARRTTRSPRALSRSARRAAPEITSRGPASASNQEGLLL